MTPPGRIVILNGAPRSGKSSTARAIRAATDEPWMLLGVDAVMALTPPPLRPSIGLRPGGERPDLEPFVVRMFDSMYAVVAAECRRGTNVVVDVGHHDAYSTPLDILPSAARRLSGLPALLVGVRCPIETVMARRDASPRNRYLGTASDGTVPDPVRAWQAAVHRPGVYDLEIDTGVMTPEECAITITARLHALPESAALRALAA